MKRIDKLTEEQRAQMKPWADKWVEIGLRTGDADWDTFDKYMPICYEKAGIPYPKSVVRVSSPTVGALASAIARELLKGDSVQSADDSAVGPEVDSAVDSEVGPAVVSAVGSVVISAVGSVVDLAVGSEIRSAVISAIGSAVDSAVNSAIGSAVDSEVHSAVGPEASPVIKNMGWHPWLGGQFWVGGWWGSPSFVSFFTDVCGLELEEDIQERATAYRKVCESVNYIWPNRNFVMVCDRPKEIHRDENGQLHNENDLAIRYGDGWGLYMWHGIKVPKWLITTKAEDLTVDQYLSLESADQKIAFIEKAGINCLLSKGKLIDSYKNYVGTEFAERFPIEVSEYELYDMSSIFDGDKRAVYLSMNHLSTGAKVFECVDNNRTLPEALAYRLNLPVSVVNEVRVTDAV